MSENSKQKSGNMFLAEAGSMLLVGLYIFTLTYFEVVKLKMDTMVCYLVLAVLGIAAIGFECRRKSRQGMKVSSFWTCFLTGMLVSFVCVFLPDDAWPFLPVFVLLGLFGSMELSVFGGAILLLIPVCLTGSGTAVFFMYLISGIVGAVLFSGLGNDFRFGVPLLLSETGLFVCEFAGSVLLKNARPEVDFFVLPMANVLVCAVLLFVILRFYSERVVYRYRGQYADLNDPESPILAQLRKTDKRAYMQSVHTAYFCERIAVKLCLDAEALKCAGYYHDLKDPVLAEKKQKLMEEKSFPPGVMAILEDEKVLLKDTVVLLTSEAVIRQILIAIERSEDKTVNYDGIIEDVFASFEKKRTFSESEITMRELNTMLKIFKEEKLYYDFLR